MPLDIQCSQCDRKFRVPQKFSGKRVKCPNCATPIDIPPTESPSPAPLAQPGSTPQEERPPAKREAAKPEAAKPESPKSAAAGWFMKTKDDSQYGPVSKQELDDWVAEGRIDTSCQLLEEDGQQWQWAEEIYPNLTEAEPAVVGPVEVAPGEPVPAVAEIPDFAAAPEAPTVEAVAPEIPDLGAATSVAPSTSSGRAAPRRRPYPALLTTAKVYTIMAWVVGVFGVLGAIGYAYSTLDDPNLSAAVKVFRLLAGEIGISAYTFFLVITLRASSEFITLAMNVEHDIHTSTDASQKMVDLLSKDR